MSDLHLLETDDRQQSEQCHPPYNLRKQVARANAESASKSADVFQADVSLAALDAADVVSVQAAALPEFLL